MLVRNVRVAEDHEVPAELADQALQLAFGLDRNPVRILGARELRR
jgi:hypothetical protein